MKRVLLFVVALMIVIMFGQLVYADNSVRITELNTLIKQSQQRIQQYQQGIQVERDTIIAANAVVGELTTQDQAAVAEAEAVVEAVEETSEAVAGAAAGAAVGLSEETVAENE